MKDPIRETNQFDKDKHLKKIQSASSIFTFFILINVALIVFYTRNMIPGSTIFILMLIASAINIFLCVVFMQAFKSIKEYLSYISDRMGS